MSATPQPMSVPRSDPTSRLAIARVDHHQPPGRRVVQRYEAGVEKIRWGRLEVTLRDWLKAQYGMD